MSAPWQIHAAVAAHVPGPWIAHARCSEVDPEQFFPEAGQSANNARQICRGCEVRVDCLRYAMDSPIPLHGVWGGTTARDRRDLRRRPA